MNEIYLKAQYNLFLKTIATIDLYHGAAILIFSHSHQCNQTEAGRRNSLVPFCTINISIHYCYRIQGLGIFFVVLPLQRCVISAECFAGYVAKNTTGNNTQVGFCPTTIAFYRVY